MTEEAKHVQNRMKTILFNLVGTKKPKKKFHMGWDICKFCILYGGCIGCSIYHHFSNTLCADETFEMPLYMHIPSHSEKTITTVMAIIIWMEEM